MREDMNDILMDKSIDRKENKRKFYFSIAILLSIFVVVGNFGIRAILNYHYINIIKRTTTQSEMYAKRVSNNINANEVINGLLEEKLLTACKVIVSNSNSINNEYLLQQTNDLNVDKINWYNKEGELLYSNDKLSNLKYRIRKEENDFMIAYDFFVEPIKFDLDSSTYMKYAYMKDNFGNLVQVGILADNIFKLISDICTHTFIEEISSNDEVYEAIFIKDTDSIIACNKVMNLSSYELDEGEKNHYELNEPHYSEKLIDGTKVYEVMMPIFVDDKRTGALIIKYSMENNNKIITLISISALFFLFALYLTYVLLIANLWKQKQEVVDIAYYDPSSNLLNYKYFSYYLSNYISKEVKSKLYIILVKCDNYNLIRHIYGEEKVKELIIRKSKILKKFVAKDKRLFQYKEDVFCILANDNEIKGNILNFIQEIKCLCIDENEGSDYGKLMTLRTGTLIVTKKNKSVEAIQNQIEKVILRLSEVNKDIIIPDYEIEEDIIQNENLEKELRNAALVNFDEFYLDYQPLFKADSNEIIRLEALTRWKNKELGQIPPSSFIQMAENIQLIIPLGNWVLTKVCRFIKKMNEENIRDIRVAVNISIIQLLDDNFTMNLDEILEKEGVKPSSIELEITESSFAKNIDYINDKLLLLKDRGFSISLDDFGTGYSSLARLSNIKINTLKIDKSFIDNINKTEQGNIFIKNIISLAKELGLETVAEGVETREQNDYLIEYKCDLIQGFLFSKPLGEEEIINLIKY